MKGWWYAGITAAWLRSQKNIVYLEGYNRNDRSLTRIQYRVGNTEPRSKCPLGRTGILHKRLSEPNAYRRRKKFPCSSEPQGLSPNNGPKASPQKPSSCERPSTNRRHLGVTLPPLRYRTVATIRFHYNGKRTFLCTLQKLSCDLTPFSPATTKIKGLEFFIGRISVERSVHPLYS